MQPKKALRKSPAKVFAFQFNTNPEVRSGSWFTPLIINQFEKESILHQMELVPETGMVVAATSPGGSKEKRKWSSPKNDTLAIWKAGGSQSLPQAKIIILEDSGLRGGDQSAQASSTIVPKQKSICKKVKRLVVGMARGQN